MIGVEYKRSLLGQTLEAKLARMRDLSPADADAEQAVKRVNRGISFKPGHPLSHMLVNNGRVEVGSRAAGYFKLLILPADKLARIYADWIVNGNARGDVRGS